VVLTQGRFDPSEILELIERERVTMWGAVPTMVHRVVDCPQAEPTDLSSLEHVSIGGAPLPPDVLERARALLGARVRLGNGYGLTETHGPITMNAGSSLADRPDSVGRPTPLIDIRIVTDSGTAPAGTVGEVQVHGPTVTPGYWNRAEDNAQQLQGGWLRTGDAGYLDADGYLYLVDRLKDMIIRAGENVYCSEVEAALARIPEVDEAAVFGVPDPDLGERVEAAVRLVEDADADAQALLRALDGKLARYKIPARIHLLGEPLPRNAAGKLLKGEIRALSSSKRA
jgi:long-chain acyl-CoA synthetase